MSEVAEIAWLTPRELPSPDEVMGVVDASGLVTTRLLELCQLYGMAWRGYEGSQDELAELSATRGWRNGRLERAARAAAVGVSLEGSANAYLDEIRALLPASALAAVWWQ